MIIIIMAAMVAPPRENNVRTISSLAASLSPSLLFEAIDLSSRFRARPDNPAITIYYLLAWV